MRKLEGLTSHFYLLTYFDVPSIVINPRRVVAFAAALVCALLLLQYAHRRQPLHNRRFLDQVIDRELQRHARFNLPMSLLFVDVDRFKAVNDSLGHDAGDRVRQFVARFLKRHIREADYVFRYGGDASARSTCRAARPTSRRSCTRRTNACMWIRRGSENRGIE